MAAMSNKVLIAFDFDHSIIDGNSDVVVQGLYPLPLPEEIKRLYCSGQGWTDYMGAIFALLHSHGAKEAEMKSKMLTIPLINGMKELFEFLKNDQYEVIIVSDSNTLFIDWLIHGHGIQEQVNCVYSNPAKFNEEGKLMIEYFHRQNWCDLSSKNMCKGHIVENHVKERGAEGVSYSRICYVGDGSNDYCPTLRLSANDYVFPRTGFPLERKIKEGGRTVKARVVPWQSGMTILETLSRPAE